MKCSRCNKKIDLKPHVIQMIENKVFKVPDPLFCPKCLDIEIEYQLRGENKEENEKK